MEAIAKLNNYPTSPRKMRLLADLIRGLEVEKALGILQFNPKHPAVPMYKLLKSAINNWEQKNTDEKAEDAGLFVKTIMVDCGRVLKRMRPAPQGRGYRIRKRSNHVTIIVDSSDVKAPYYPEKETGKTEVVSEPAEVVKEDAAPSKASTKKTTPEKGAAAKEAKPKKEPAEKKDSSSKTEKKPSDKKAEK